MLSNSRFKLRHLMVNVSSEEGPEGQGQIYLAGSACGRPSCIAEGPCNQATGRPDVTSCPRPSCKGDHDDRSGEGRPDESACSALALLQRELRQAMSLER